MTEKPTIFDMPLDRITTDPNQPRKHFDKQKLNELAESIKQHGLLQPILVRPNGDGTFQIVHGERRFRAHQIAALPTIKCIVKEMSDRNVADARVVENVEREDLSDLELAKEFQKRIEKGETHQQIADAIKKTRAYVTQRLALLRLPENVQRKLEEKKIDFTEARILATAKRENVDVPRQHGYGVTMEQLEVYKLFQKGEKQTLDLLYRAYRKDLATIQRAILEAKR